MISKYLLISQSRHCLQVLLPFPFPCWTKCSTNFSPRIALGFLILSSCPSLLQGFRKGAVRKNRDKPLPTVAGCFIFNLFLIPYNPEASEAALPNRDWRPTQSPVFPGGRTCCSRKEHATQPCGVHRPVSVVGAHAPSTSAYNC